MQRKEKGYVGLIVVSAPGQLLRHREGDLAVVELLGAVTLAERRRDRRGLDDAQRREPHAMPGGHLLWASNSSANVSVPAHHGMP